MSESAPDTSLQAILRRLRQLEIRIRKVVDAQLQGDFHSVFKGTGLEFDDVRQYQYGDEVRAIDWAVSAKGHGTFVKTYKEEREQSVVLLLDVSRSQQVGAEGRRKLDVAREICGILALSAARQDAQLGVLAFSDQKELYLPAGKGIRHAYALIKAIFGLQPQSPGTNVAAGIRQAKVVLVCTNKPEITNAIVDLIRSEFPDARLFERSYDRNHSLSLRERGVAYELRETLESALRFGGETLHELGLEMSRVDEIVAAMRFIVATPTLTGQTIVLDGGQRFLALPRDVQFMEFE